MIKNGCHLWDARAQKVHSTMVEAANPPAQPNAHFSLMPFGQMANVCVAQASQRLVISVYAMEHKQVTYATSVHINQIPAMYLVQTRASAGTDLLIFAILVYQVVKTQETMTHQNAV